MGVGTVSWLPGATLGVCLVEPALLGLPEQLLGLCTARLVVRSLGLWGQPSPVPQLDKASSHCPGQEGGREGAAIWRKRKGLDVPDTPSRALTFKHLVAVPQQSLQAATLLLEQLQDGRIKHTCNLTQARPSCAWG